MDILSKFKISTNFFINNSKYYAGCSKILPNCEVFLDKIDMPTRHFLVVLRDECIVLYGISDSPINFIISKDPIGSFFAILNIVSKRYKINKDIDEAYVCMLAVSKIYEEKLGISL